MKIALTGYYSIGIEKKIEIVTSISEKLRLYFSDLNYGSDLKEILIGIICVAPEFEKFNQPRKPKYIEFRKSMTNGLEVVEEKVFIYEIVIDYEDFYFNNDSDNISYLINELLKSLKILDNLPKKIKNFNKEQFINDFEKLLNF
jgi:hypothetical protein